MILSAAGRIWLIVITGLISLGMAVAVSGLRYDYSVESFFPAGDPELAFFEAVQDSFREDNLYVTVGIREAQSFFQGNAFPRLDSLVKALEQLDGVAEVTAATNLSNQLFSWMGRAERAFFHPDNQKTYPQDSAFFRAYTDLWGKFFSPEATATCLYLNIRRDLSPETRTALVAGIRQQLISHGFLDTYLYGDIIARDANVQELQREILRLSGLALALMVVVLLLSFRSLRVIVLPMLIVGITVLWTLGLMALAGMAINLMTVLIPTIVSIVALGDAIHLLSGLAHQPGHFSGTTNEEEASSLRDRLTATLHSIRQVIFLTSATTALGFLSLAWSRIQPFTEFGIFTAMGVLIAWGLSVVLLPALILVFRAPVRANNTRWSLSAWMAGVLAPGVLRHYRLILAGSVGMVMLALWGASAVRVNATLYEDISSGDEFSRTLHFFEEEFGGIRSVDLVLTPADDQTTFLDSATWQEVERIHRFLADSLDVQDLRDVTTVMKRANRSLHGGKPAAFVLPEGEEADFIRIMMTKSFDDLQVRDILTPGFRLSKITGRMQDLGSHEVNQRNERLQHFLQDSIPSGLLQVQQTGAPYLLDKSNRLIAHNLMWGLLLAIFLVSGLMGWMYQSWRMIIVAMVPNLLPLLIMLGLMGWLDIGLKMSTAVTFTIAFGIAVDDTIHMMSRLRKELQAGRSVAEAIRQSFFTTGKAIVVTSAILVCGFGILLFSSFHSSFLTGLLISVTLLLALFADLLLLPTLLLWLYKRQQPS